MEQDLHYWKSLREDNDASALKFFYNQYIKLLYKYGYHFCQDANMVEDCVQDLFLRLWEKRSSLGDTNNVKLYLMVALKRSIYEKVKKGAKTSNTGDEVIETFDTGFTMEESIITSETEQINKEKLLQTLEHLSGRQKEVIYLRFYNGFSPEEVSEVMNISNQSVRNLQASALKKMRSNMGDSLILFVIGKIIVNFFNFL
ncbi:RNA polymerase sigma factor [Flammeovirga kamogawensis]|uniref:Sigma-70 family RNA polymerase sigma factor n=1 Tax=Flammeovirga kamogawensis TaxID=373891 RepID=A0ABX8GRI0_9BACT|nr:sigma-70 family RNA polymerase sigma factor [Flammeovirga kamogawensis]MBB6462128.1 RNA polymerase sigma factor (sigma-70 family) [Flammeovirga kamogawensis]QWG05862.1 sigma-70 family RNA polymerase sigma factor [Flammeovirga kamogawensis]TRX67686.1 sigma-70 family RNA polymerase sigma factor [Flammeovirga kamogawensis]